MSFRNQKQINFDSDIESKLGVNATDIEFVNSLEESDTPHIPRYEDEQTKDNRFATPGRDSLDDEYFD